MGIDRNRGYSWFPIYGIPLVENVPKGFARSPNGSGNKPSGRCVYKEQTYCISREYNFDGTTLYQDEQE
jgi:hypothetical protein